MQAVAIDERQVVREHGTASFVAFIYEGGDAPTTSWSVRSHLVTDTDLSQVLRWLRDHVPTDACWSLGIVLAPADPAADSSLEVAWVVGCDVLNMDPDDRTPAQQRAAAAMLARRHRVTLP